MAENEKEISRLLSSRGVRSVFGLSNLEGYNEVDLRKKYRKSALLVVGEYIYLHVYIYAHVYMYNVYTYMCMYKEIFMFICVCVHVYIYVYL
jgi:hypothetical protein